MRRAVSALVALACVSFAALPALAATKTPLGALATSPAPLAARDDAKTVASLAGVTIDTKPPYPKATFVNAHADTKNGFCFVALEEMLRLSSTTSTATGSDPEELWHLDTTGGAARLERTSFAIDRWSHEPSVARRTTVTLQEVARSPEGVVVWAFRMGRDVVLLARGASGGVEGVHTADDAMGAVPFTSSDCAFGAIRLDPAKPDIAATGQLTGFVPSDDEGAKSTDKPFFTVDASVSRVGRQPEPRLAVRVRVQRR